MFEEKDRIVKTYLYHYCPVCKHKTKEEYEVHSTYLDTYNKWVNTLVFKKEINDLAPFERNAIGPLVILTCPRCGVMLSGEICEEIKDK